MRPSAEDRDGLRMRPGEEDCDGLRMRHEADHRAGLPHQVRPDLRNGYLHRDDQEVRCLPGYPLRDGVRPGSADDQGQQVRPDLR